MTRHVTNEDLADELAAIKAALHAASLNGETKAIRELAKATPDLLVVAKLAPSVPALQKVAAHADAVVADAEATEERRAGVRWLRKVTGWDHGSRGLFLLVLNAVISALILLYLTAKVTGHAP